jgi:glycosyltransferase involved in cell wall biosynthesis
MALYKFLDRVYQLKKHNSNLLVINRIDGPVYYIRDKDIEVDKAFYKFNNLVCDGTIFQSKWSKKFNFKLGMINNKFETVILNAPNKKIFNRVDSFEKNIKKTKIIATSWSSNWKKGFSTYEWLDKHLDFNKFQFVFIGNTPVKFKNIIYKGPMNSEDLSIELKKSDIFLTASQKDPCSNSLIEAMHCGLPSIGLDDGGHTEIIGKGGEVFSKHEDVLIALEKIKSDYQSYQKSINLLNIDEVGQTYYQFLEMIYNEQKDNKYKAKKFNFFSFISLKIMLFKWRAKEFTFNKIKKYGKLFR